MNPNYSGSFSEGADVCRVKNLPLKRWVHIVISIQESAFDVYINNKLYKTSVLDAPLKQLRGDLFMTQYGGFGGAISQFRVFPFTLSVEEIDNIYFRGPDNTNHIIRNPPGIPKLNICAVCDNLNKN